jgi:hypothetical protein
VSFLPEEDSDWLTGSGFTFEEVEEPLGAELKRGIIVRNYLLPSGKFQVAHASILVQIPRGYPDATLDMFWADPALVLAPSGKQPNATVPETHFGSAWQRWSRHYKPGQWRSGIDDLSSHFTVIYAALQDAA